MFDYHKYTLYFDVFVEWDIRHNYSKRSKFKKLLHTIGKKIAYSGEQAKTENFRSPLWEEKSGLVDNGIRRVCRRFSLRGNFNIKLNAVTLQK